MTASFRTPISRSFSVITPSCSATCDCSPAISSSRLVTASFRTPISRSFSVIAPSLSSICDCSPTISSSRLMTASFRTPISRSLSKILASCSICLSWIRLNSLLLSCNLASATANCSLKILTSSLSEFMFRAALLQLNNNSFGENP